MKRIILLMCVSLSLGACTTVMAGVDTAKSFVYKKGADTLNDYCEVRDESIAQGLVGRINDGLTEEGFAGSIDMEVNCP